MKKWALVAVTLSLLVGSSFAQQACPTTTLDQVLGNACMIGGFVFDFSVNPTTHYNGTVVFLDSNSNPISSQAIDPSQVSFVPSAQGSSVGFTLTPPQAALSVSAPVDQSGTAFFYLEYGIQAPDGSVVTGSALSVAGATASSPATQQASYAPSASSTASTHNTDGTTNNSADSDSSVGAAAGQPTSASDTGAFTNPASYVYANLSETVQAQGGGSAAQTSATVTYSTTSVGP